MNMSKGKGVTVKVARSKRLKSEEKCKMLIFVIQ